MMNALSCKHLEPLEQILIQKGYALIAVWQAERSGFSRCVYFTPDLTPQALIDQLPFEQRTTLLALDNGSTNYTGPVVGCRECMTELGMSPHDSIYAQ